MIRLGNFSLSTTRMNRLTTAHKRAHAILYDGQRMIRKWVASPEILTGLIVWSVVFALYLSTLAPSLSWGFEKTGVDGGEFLAAAANFGVPHPPGYPTYTLLLKGFATIVPIGDFAFRGNLLSAILGALSAVLIYAVVVNFGRLLPKESNRLIPILSGSLGAAVFAASPLFWSQSVITEVYTLNTAFAGALILIATHLALPRSGQEQSGIGHIPIWVAMFGFLLGVGLGNHLTLIAVAGPLLLWMWVRLGRRRILSLWMIVPLILGAGIYVYLPISAAQHPPVNWGDANSLDGFAWMVSGRAYQTYAFGVPMSSLPDRLISWLELIFAQFNPLGIFLGVVGGAWLYARERVFFWATLASMLILLIYALMYNTVDSEVLTIPAFYVFSIWIGLGIWRITLGALWFIPSISKLRIPNWVRQLTLSSGQIVWLLAAVGFLALPTTAVALNYGAQNLRNDRQAIEHAREIFDSVPDGSLIFSTKEDTTFSLWYMGFVEAVERDIATIAAPLLQFDWYWRDMHRRFPDRIPATLPDDDTSVMQHLISYNDQTHKVYFTYKNVFVATEFNLAPQGPVYEATLKSSR